MTSEASLEPSRRDVLRASSIALAAPAVLRFPSVLRASELRVGVIGCGGRGTGAAVNALEACPEARVVALADAFADRVASSRAELEKPENGVHERVRVDDAHCFAGLDAYQKLLASGVDVAILATCPHFRPIHLAAAIAAGAHCFMEKPAGVDPTGVRAVLAAADQADAKALSIVAGTQRRHEQCYREAMQRIRAGAIGRIVSARCSWNQGGLWVKERQSAWSDMEWMLRNWLYFPWTSGDHIVEQHVHNLDVVRWAIGADPISCVGLGGRQARVEPQYGSIYDHFAIEYDFPEGVKVHSYCRQIDGSEPEVEELLVGTRGRCKLRSGFAEITGEQPWRFEGEQVNPYVQEHIDLFQAIQAGVPINEAREVARSTLMAVMGRMASYTGKRVSFKFALEQSKLDLAPPHYAFGPVPMPAVAIPGRTPLV